MPKKRVIAAILVKRGWAVQSEAFGRYLPIGRPEIAARFFSEWGADEILLLDIDASHERRTIAPELVARVARSAYVPLTVGGGLRSVDDVRRVVQAGADKVSINLGAFEAPEQVKAAAEAFGNQCIVGAMDIRRGADGRAMVFAEGGRRETGLDAAAHAGALAAMDVGEVLVNSIDRDGARSGFDIDAIRSAAGAVRAPIIALGGAGHPTHLYDVLRLDEVSAAAAGNFFHYTEHAIATCKAYLHRCGLDVRMEGWADYRLFESSADGRIRKRPEDELADEIYEFIPEEII